MTLSADDLHVIKWYVDASFAVHADFKSHTGAVMTMGNGTIQSISKKQKLNTKSSTESEIAGVSDFIPWTVWIKRVMECQDYFIKRKYFIKTTRV